MTSNVRFYVQPTLKTLLQVVTKEQMANTQQFEKCLNSLQSQPIVNGNNNRQKPDIEFHTKWHIYNTIDVQCIQFWNAHAQWILSWPAWPHRVNKTIPTTANCQLYFLTSPNIGILPLYFWLNAIILGICKFKTQVYTLDLNKQTPCKLLWNLNKKIH